MFDIFCTLFPCFLFSSLVLHAFCTVCDCTYTVRCDRLNTQFSCEGKGKMRQNRQLYYTLGCLYKTHPPRGLFSINWSTLWEKPVQIKKKYICGTVEIHVVKLYVPFQCSTLDMQHFCKMLPTFLLLFLWRHSYVFSSVSIIELRALQVPMMNADDTNFLCLEALFVVLGIRAK